MADTPLTHSTLPTPATSTPEPTQSSFPTLPRVVTAPIEATFAAIGGLASASTEWVGARGTRAASRARPWLEFIDLSAFSLAEGGPGAYLDRLRLNAPYFMFNYIMLGLALTIFSVITKPLALLGSLLLVWLYFQFFGVDSGEEYMFMGFSLDTSEKVGVMVFLGCVVFWFTVGGFGVFLSVLTAVAFVTLLHGCLRRPSVDAVPIV